jgi:hypothetical protein
MVDLAIGGLVDGGLIDEEGVEGETGVPLAALGVEDPEGRPTPRRSVAVVRDEGLCPLTHDVTAQPDPRTTRQLQPDAGRLGDRGREPAAEARRVEDQQQGLRPSGECGKSLEPVGDPRRLVGPG